jgi:serralysin
MKSMSWLCVCSCLVACAPEPAIDVSETTEHPAGAPSWDEFRANPPVTWDQFRATVYRERSAPHRFIVDGDIALSGESELRAYYDAWLAQEHAAVAGTNSALTVQRVLGVDLLQPSPQRFQLTYCISNAFGTAKANVIEAMTRATQSWNERVAVHFSYRPDQDANCNAGNNSVFFNVSPNNEDYFANAFFPAQSRPDRQLFITPLGLATNAGGRDLQGILRHETGHVLGFRHEHLRISCQGSLPSDHRTVTSYDVNSVMHYPQCRPSRGGGYRQTALDFEGAISLYGPADLGPAAADYDGDGRFDLAVKSRDLSGVWMIDFSQNLFGRWDVVLDGFGGTDSHPVPADYDGDGKADLAVKNDSTGDWYIDFAIDGFGFPAFNPSYGGFGGAPFHAVPADYDGDGKADLSVKGDFVGDWYIDFASNGFGGFNPSVLGWGDETQIPVPGDYDDDGKADLAIFKVENGSWHIDFAIDGFDGVDVTIPRQQ